MLPLRSSNGDSAQRRRGSQVDGPVRLVTAISPARRSRLTLRLLVFSTTGPSTWSAEMPSALSLSLAVQPRELQIRAAGMEMDDAVDVLQMRRAEELAVHGHRSGDVGQRYILRMALNSDAAVHAVRGDGRAAIVDVGGDRAP